MSALQIVAFVALGLFAGTYGTLVGVGGGLLIVPVLLLAHAAPKDAAGTSMAVILANAASGSYSYLRQRLVNVRAGFIFAIAGLPGALLGGLADQYVPRRLFSLLFGLLLAVIAARIFITEGQRDDADRPAIAPEHPHAKEFAWMPAAAIGLGAGFVASMFGIGGGLVFVPSLVYLFAFPAHVATATSTFIIALNAIFATASHAYYGDVLWGPAVAIAAGAVVGAQIGSRVAKHVRRAALLRLFSAAVMVTAFWLLYKALV